MNLMPMFVSAGKDDMKYSYDPESDILIIRLSDEKPDFGEQQNNVIAHYNKKGKPVEIEILDARKEALGMLKAILAKAP